MSGAFERLTPRLNRSDLKRAGNGAKSDLSGSVRLTRRCCLAARETTLWDGRWHLAEEVDCLLLISLRCKSLAGMLTRETLIYWLLAPSSAADA